MIRLGSLVGLPAALHGRMVGQVEQAVLTPDGQSLRGLIIRRGMGGARWVGSGGISVLGDVAVVLRCKPDKLPAGADFALTSVKDSAGLNLGRVTDAFLHRESFRVAALEISLGLVEDLTCGRMLARSFTVRPAPDDPGQVLIPCGCSLEKPQ